MTMMLPTTLSMLFLTLGCPPEELPQPPAEPVASASKDSVRGLLDQAEQVAATLESWTRPALYRTENDLTGDSVLRTGWISWRRLQDNVTVGLLLEWEVVDRARRKKVKDFILQGPFLWEVEHEGKLRIKRRLSTDDSATTLSALGRGPLPLPIGMSADAVLAKFSVTEGFALTLGCWPRFRTTMCAISDSHPKTARRRLMKWITPWWRTCPMGCLVGFVWNDSTVMFERGVLIPFEKGNHPHLI